jgi:hypothetical protein
MSRHPQTFTTAEVAQLCGQKKSRPNTCALGPRIVRKPSPTAGDPRALSLRQDGQTPLSSITNAQMTMSQTGHSEPVDHVLGHARLSDIDAELEEFSMIRGASHSGLAMSISRISLRISTELLACHPALSISVANTNGSRRDAI